jgi:hypothetical protein
MAKPIIWSLADPWNEAAKSEDRPLKPREYLYASNIFDSHINTYLSMIGVEPSNPANDRSRRKFFAGHVWEYIVKQVLLVSGLYHQEEIKIDATPFRNLLSVHGRCDFLAGGLVDKDEAWAKIKEHNLPDILHGIAHRAIDKWHGLDLEKKILEIKSVALYTYDYVEKRRRPIDGHAGQAYHYQRNNKEGLKADIVYVSKDTALLSQFPLPMEHMEEAYMKDIAIKTYFYEQRNKKGFTPPLDKLLDFDQSVGNFSKNLKVEYSNYLTMLYGYASPDEYRRSIQPQVLRWNNALTRYAKNEKGDLTPTGKAFNMAKAKEVRQEIINSGYDFNELLQIKMQFLGEGDVSDDE